jgi:hypothetical protein
MPDIPLYQIDEQYPDNNSPNDLNRCQHGSKTVKIT